MAFGEGFDPESVLPFRDVGLALRAAYALDFPVPAGALVYATVRAWNAAGLVTESSSTGALYDSTPPVPGYVTVRPLVQSPRPSPLAPRTHPTAAAAGTNTHTHTHTPHAPPPRPGLEKRTGRL